MTTGSQGQAQADGNQGEGLEGAPLVPVDAGRTAPLAKTDDEGPGMDGKKPPVKEPVKDEPKLDADGKPVDDAGDTDDGNDEPKPEWDGEYVQFDDPAGQSVVNLLNAAGVTAREANAYFKDALDSGDPSKVDWKAIEGRLGKDQAALAKIGMDDYYKRVYSRNIATKEAVLEVVGGDKNWNKMVKWAGLRELSDPAFADELNDLRAGIAAGGRNAKRAAQDLIDLYEADTKNSGLGIKKLTEGDTPTNKLDGEPLSRSDYFKAVQALDKEKGTPASKQGKIKALQNRRQAGRAQGL